MEVHAVIARYGTREASSLTVLGGFEDPRKAERAAEAAEATRLWETVEVVEVPLYGYVHEFTPVLEDLARDLKEEY